MKAYIPSRLKDIPKLRDLIGDGVRVERDGAKVTCVATNGRTLIAVESDGDDFLHPPLDTATSDDGSVTVPATEWVEAFRRLPKRSKNFQDNYVGIGTNEGETVTLTSGTSTAVTIDVDMSHYPRWRRVIPTEFSGSLVLDIDHLTTLLNTMKSSLDADHRDVTLRVPVDPKEHVVFEGNSVTGVIAQKVDHTRK